MNKAQILYLFMLIVSQLDAQEAKFSWSLGDFGWSYNFLNKHDVVDANILKFNVSFDKINVTISTYISSGTNKNNREENDPFYNSLLPLEITYTPFTWKYANISLYGRASWETCYRGNVENPDKVSDGFYGYIGFKFGLGPIQSDFFKYSSHIIYIFSEYTTHNEYKLGISIDLFDIVVLAIWAMENKATNEYNAH
ncbi:MAG: hypothetical protein LBG05_00515 [Treponema sp.]|jgi:hypothetical protein|nr:hypothetical protein [Treponema sp.]